MIRRVFLLYFICCFLCVYTIAAGQFTADLVILNGKIRTLDDKSPVVEAAAVKDGKIAATGSTAAIRKLAGAKTKIIDAGGKLVLPGFNDSHVHFLGIGSAFFSVDLRRAGSLEHLLSKIKFNARFIPEGQWILGSGWNSKSWKNDDLPRRESLDTAAPGNPVLLYSDDYRLAVANSAALKLAGFDKPSKIIKNGVIERNADGSPTGILRGDAIAYLRALGPKLADKQELEALETATNYAASLGVTSVHDVHSDDITPLMTELEKSGKLKTRVYDCISLTKWKELNDAGIAAASGSPMIRRGCLKHFSDGDAEVIPDLLAMMIPADKAGLQIAVHAIGQRANNVVLELLDQIIKRNGSRDRRFRVEHAHNFSSVDGRRFSALRAIASMQPHLFGGGEPYRSLLQSNTRLAFGSDASITDLDPLLGIHAAVNSGAERSISVEDAVRAYTLGSAYAEYQENVKGSISIGKLADLVILSDDIFVVPNSKIREARVLTTILDGKIVYEAK